VLQTTTAIVAAATTALKPEIDY